MFPLYTNALCNKGWHFWKGGFVTDKTGLKIFVFINAMIFAFTTFVTNTPLYGKIASKVWKIYFQYISPHFLDAAGSQISDLWLLLLSNSSLFSALMSHLPLLLLHSAMLLSKWELDDYLKCEFDEYLKWGHNAYLKCGDDNYLKWGNDNYDIAPCQWSSSPELLVSAVDVFHLQVNVSCEDCDKWWSPW